MGQRLFERQTAVASMSRLHWLNCSRVLQVVPRRGFGGGGGGSGDAGTGILRQAVQLANSTGFHLSSAPAEHSPVPQVVSMWGLGGGLGVLATGILGQWLYNWRKGAMPLYSGLSIMVATVPILWLINGRVAQLPLLAMFVSLVGGALSAPPGPCAR